MKLQKPFLKWVGGKTQLIHRIIEHYPNEIQNYHEPFLGGGSTLFALLTLQKEGKIKIHGNIYAYDINKVLIDVYIDVQKNKDTLFTYIQDYIREYNNISGNEVNRNPETLEDGKTSKESYYYWIRNKYNTIKDHSVERSALFLFLNKTCFRGMYREGPRGFNVPYGHYKKTPTIITKSELDTISELLQKVHFKCSDFKDSLCLPQKGDFVYLDPPYAPQNKTSFVSYVADGFDKHELLFQELKRLHENEILFLMSNAKVELVMKKCSEFECEDVLARRAIHAKNPGTKTTEVLIYNVLKYTQ